MNDSIFAPILLLVGLTFAVLVLMYIRRIGEIFEKRVHLQSLADSNVANNRLTRVSAADNFRNLFEVPVLFYVICLILYATSNVSQSQLTLAWVYVVLRVLHSVVHVTYNKVLHRWLLYIASTACLFLMWLIFAIAYLSQ